MAIERLRGAVAGEARIVGAAAQPRVPWRPNPPGTPRRTLAEALEIARKNGVDIPDDEFVITVAPSKLRDHATYFGLDVEQQRGRAFIVELEKLQTKDRKFGVLLSPDTLDSDDAIVAVLAHEVHEARALEADFHVNGGRLTALRVYSLVNKDTGTLHCAAWDYADELVRRRHGSKDV